MLALGCACAAIGLPLMAVALVDAHLAWLERRWQQRDPHGGVLGVHEDTARLRADGVWCLLGVSLFVFGMGILSGL